MQFELISKLRPTGDQPQAIKELSKNIIAGVKHQVLLGVTGSGKTFTMSNVIAKTQKPALVISPNKTLAAQLYQEFKDLFPNNAVHYFVSYYDYYQPEAYIPQTDTYIEKDAKINDVLDRMRHEAVQDVLTRKDSIVVASVSCIYNIGSPQDYQNIMLEIKSGQEIKRRDFLSHLTSLQYQRNDIDFTPGAFRIRGNIVEIFNVTGKEVVRVEFAGDHIEELSIAENTTELLYKPFSEAYKFYPAKFWVTPEDKLNIALENIRLELQEQVKKLKKQNKLLEAQRLEQRTNYDLEMIEESGYCHGIENYSRHFEFRKPGDPPYTLLDYFREDFLMFVDESHLTLSQIRAMSQQDKVRKESLVSHGFRLPSAIDNRPLTFEEVYKKVPQFVYVSATPGNFEIEQAHPHIIEQIIRPTGLVEPSTEVRPTENQIQDLMKEIQKNIKKKQRTLVITLTKRLAEEIASYLLDKGIKTEWLHSEIKTLERPLILENLRKGTYDVLVGINLLREGLDLPEVTLVAILDADKEGFLRNETTLIQTMGRAARHPNGRVIMYADKVTGSMKNAIKEVDRRRRIQEKHNKEHGITPKAIEKAIKEWPFPQKQKGAIDDLEGAQDIELLESEMKQAADNLDFERAASVRDLIKRVKSKKIPSRNPPT